MAHSNTIINQIAAFFPRHDFGQLVKIYITDQKLSSFTRWSQFLAMMTGQPPGRKSLRDLVSNIRVHGRRIYHLGMKPTCKSTLARVNELHPYQLYREMFFKLSPKCKMF